jgi:hypothetical protein
MQCNDLKNQAIIWGCKQLFLGRNVTFCRKKARCFCHFLLKDGQKSHFSSAKLFFKAKTLVKFSLVNAERRVDPVDLALKNRNWF